MTKKPESKKYAPSELVVKTEKIRQAVTERFTNAVNHVLIKQGRKQLSRRDVAESLNMHYQTLSSMLNHPDQVSVTVANLSLACTEFDVNPVFLLTGEGEMLLTEKKPVAPPVDNDLKSAHLDEVVNHLKKVNEEKSEIISELKEQIKYYKERLAKCEGASK